MNLRCGRHAGWRRIWIADGTDTVVHPVSVRAEGDISEGRLLAPHWTIESFRPVIETAARAFVKPGEGAGANHAPSFEQPGAAHHSQKRQWIIYTRSAVKRWVVYVCCASRTRSIDVDGDEFRIHERGTKGGFGGLNELLVM